MKFHTLFFQKLGKGSQNLSSAAVVIGALRVKMGLDVRKADYGAWEQQRAGPSSYPRSLISAFIVCWLESIISKLDNAKFH